MKHYYKNSMYMDEIIKMIRDRDMDIKDITINISDDLVLTLDQFKLDTPKVKQMYSVTIPLVYDKLTKLDNLSAYVFNKRKKDFESMTWKNKSIDDLLGFYARQDLHVTHRIYFIVPSSDELIEIWTRNKQ